METKKSKTYKVCMRRDAFEKETIVKFFCDEQAIEFASIYAKAGGACYINIKRGSTIVYDGWMY